VIETSQAWVDNIEALAAGEVDVTIATPPEFAAQALHGLGQFEQRAHPGIRALGVLPHDDAILFAVPAESPLTAIEDVLEQGFPLRLAAPPDDGYCHAGWACQAVLDEYGLTPEVVKSLGGEYLYREYPRLAPPLVLTGKADAVINEAMMLPDWRDLAERRPTRFLSVREDVLDRLASKYRMRSRWVHAGRLPGQDEPIRTVDFSGWMLVAMDSMPDEVAYTLAAVMIEHRSEIERLYGSAPVHLSPLTYPIRPDQVPLTGDVPLHPGAERYYREHGLLERWT
jgi:TRAP transporter TAXI family solute receptor